MGVLYTVRKIAIIGVLVFIVLAGTGTILSPNTLITPTQAFNNELEYYKNKDKVTTEEYSFKDFKDISDFVTEKNQSGLRVEVEKIFEEIDFCRVFYDKSENVLFVSGLGEDESKRHCFYWLSE